MTFVLGLLIKVTLACGTAFVMAHLFRRSRAAVLHLCFTMTFVALVLIAAAAIALPKLALTLRAPLPPIAAIAVIPVEGGSNGAPANVSVARTSQQHAVTISQSARSWVVPAMMALWCIGAAILAIPVMVGLWQLRRLRRSASPWCEGDDLATQTAGMLGVHRQVKVFRHRAVNIPLTFGALRPVILLPDDANAWDGPALQRSLTHELEHIARGDWLTHCLARLVCCVYWFHPLVWAAWRRMQLEADRACDDAVVKQSDAVEYAALLVAMARREPTGMRQPGLAMTGRSDLAARVTAVLDLRQLRGRVGRARSAVVTLGVVAMSLTVGPFTVERAMAQTDLTRVTSPVLKFDTISIRRSTSVGLPSAKWSAIEFASVNATARVLLVLAYGPESGIRWPYPIDNAPSWIDSERFDIRATAPPEATRAQMRERLQSLLAERFGLIAEVGLRDFPVLALVPARGGYPGPRMSPSPINCQLKPSNCSLLGRTGHLEGRGLTMSSFGAVLVGQLAGSNQYHLDRPVIDRTGFTGPFDFTVDWTPDPSPVQIEIPSEAARVARESTATDWRGVLKEYREIVVPTDTTRKLSYFKPYAYSLESSAPNFLAAFREQLGIDLERQLAPQPVLSIDRIDRPVEY